MRQNLIFLLNPQTAYIDISPPMKKNINLHLILFLQLPLLHNPQGQNHKINCILKHNKQFPSSIQDHNINLNDVKKKTDLILHFEVITSKLNWAGKIDSPSREKKSSSNTLALTLTLAHKNTYTNTHIHVYM